MDHRPAVGAVRHGLRSDYDLAEDHIAGRFTARSDLAAAMLAQVDDERYIRKILAVASSENVPSVARLIVREAFS